MNRIFVKKSMIAFTVAAGLLLVQELSNPNIPGVNYSEDKIATTAVHQEQPDGFDVIQKNNERAADDLQKIRDSVGDGDTFADDGRGHYKVQRKNGSVEEYETVSGIAGFATIRTK